MICLAYIVKKGFIYAAEIVAGAQYPVLFVENHSNIEVPIKLSIGMGFNQETSDFPVPWDKLHKLGQS